MTSLTVGTSVSSNSPSISQNTSSTSVGSVVNQLVALAPGLTYNAGLPVTSIAVTVDNPVTVVAYDSTNTQILNAQVTQTSTFQITAANFKIENTSTTLTANVSLALVVPQVQQNVQYVVTVNSVTPDANGNVLITAADISGIPAQYVLPTALATRLGGIKPGTSLTIATDGTLNTALLTVNDISPDANGNIAYTETTATGNSILEVADSTGSRAFRKVVGSTAVTVTPTNGALVIDLSQAVKTALAGLGVVL